jgi:hypothetical protein
VSEVEFVLNGKRYRLSRKQVEDALEGVDPEIVWDLSVDVHGVEFPVKQAFVTPLGLTNRQTNSRFAWRILRKLGLPVRDKKADGPLPPKAGTTSAADAESHRLALALAAEVHRGSGASTDIVIAAAEAFESWLSAP